MDRQDKVNSGTYVFAQPVPFEKAFPSIKSLQIKVEIRTGGPMDARPDIRYYTSQNPPGEYVRCPRSSCTDGGWCIGDVLREMVAKGETSRKAGGICAGQERMNRSSFRKCLTLFSAEITIAYA